MRLQTISRRRPGTITVIVVAFLGLLLIMGLSFAFYGLREAEETRVYTNAQNGGQTGVAPTSRKSSGDDQPPVPDDIANVSLGTLIYGPPDDIRGAYVGIRQHDLARSVYGWNPKYPSPYFAYTAPLPGLPAPDPNRAATQPYTGVGAVPANLIDPSLPPGFNIINWSGLRNNMVWFRDNNYQFNPALTGPPVPWTYNPLTGGPGGGTDRYWAPNSDYTYPDANNLYLAAIDPMTGRVIVKSFHRDWLMTGGVGPHQPGGTPEVGPVTGLPPTPVAADTNMWTNGPGKFLTLRPRPVDHQWPPGSGLSDWRYPNLNADGTYGDVENIEGKPGGRQYDSIWVDLDFPVRTWMGKQYKPMVAFVIADLDGRVNLNVAGNLFRNASGNWENGSNQGIGPWEINPARVLNTYLPAAPTTPINRPDEAAAISQGTPAGHGRLGVTWMNGAPLAVPVKQYVPNSGLAIWNPMAAPLPPVAASASGMNVPPPGSPAHFYGGVDYFANHGQGRYSDNDPQGHMTHFTFGPGFIGTPGNPTDPVRPASMPLSPPFPPLYNPATHVSRFGGGYFITDPSGTIAFDERSHHPSLFNPYLLRSRSWLNLSMAVNRVIPNRVFGVDEMRKLNEKFNYGDYRTSELAGLAPDTLGNRAYLGNQLNSRFTITTLSNDFDRPGAGPCWGGPSGYNLAAAQAGQPQGFPTATAGGINLATPANGNGDYDDSFRTRMGNILAPIDLNRKLTDYRASLAGPLSPGNTSAAIAVRAIQDRQLLAADILRRLRYVTGLNPTSTAAPTPGNDTERWLAQLAVNIVDFIDSDECITPFKWTSANGGGADDLTNEQQAQLTGAFVATVRNDWVFGVERPRVTINETYLRVENDPMDDLMVNGMQQAEMDYRMLMWLELHNPITPATAAEQHSGPEGVIAPVPIDNNYGGYRALLKDTFAGTEKSIYRVLVMKVPNAAGNPDPLGMLPAGSRNNVAGVPNVAAPGGIINILTFDSLSVADGAIAGTPVSIQPNVGAAYRPAAGNNSFFLCGPTQDQQMGAGPAVIPSQGNPAGTRANITSDRLQATVTHAEFTVANPAAMQRGQPNWAPGFVLQRLACPALPPSSFNPYITVDYWESDIRAVNNRLKVDHGGQPGGNQGQAQVPNPPDWNDSWAWGRRQPYDGVVTYQNNNYRMAPQGIGQNDPNHTFGQHNGDSGQGQNNWSAGQTLEQPFRPFPHYDRVLLSPMELLHVCGIKPHELTRYFCGPPGPNSGLDGKNRLKYTVDWFDHQIAPGAPAGLLYRSFGLLRTPTSMHGLGMGGRVPGKININTIFNQATFEAVLDATAANRFTAADVQNSWNALVTARQPSGVTQVTVNDVPFRGNALTIDATSHRGRTVTRPDMLWPEAVASPLSRETYTAGPGGQASVVQKYEMLSKVFDQFTTRSNTFAVWMTFGYFEVKNSGPYNETNRPILGKELGLDQGTSVRHKFFAVIDRTNLSIEYNAPVVFGGPVQPPPIRQGQPPVFFSYQPNTPLPAPPAYAVANTDDPLPNNAVALEVRIPTTGAELGPGGVINAITGVYDGMPWTIRPQLSRIELDIGDRRELMVVTGVTYDAATSTAVIAMSNTTLVAGGQQGFSNPHSRGAIMRLVNPDPLQPESTPGNPGPQPGFNYKSPRYAPVVKYVEQLK